MSELAYTLKLQAAAFTGPMSQSVNETDKLTASAERAGARIDGLQTSTNNAGAGFSGLFDKAANLGGGLANIVAGAQAAHKAFTFLRGGANEAAGGVTASAKSAEVMATAAKSSGMASRLAGAGFGFMGTAAVGATVGVGALAAAVTTVAVPLTALIAVAAGLKGLSGGLVMAAELEQTTIAFRTLVGDATVAKAVLSEIKQLGAETPFEFPELADAGRKLLAFGESAGNVGTALRRIGDISSGVQAPIGEIAELYGKARVQGTLFAEDINQLTGRGIPIITEFAKVMGVSTSEVKKLASEGQITFPVLQQAFINLTSEGGKFHNMMAEQSQTTLGLLSTLKDNVSQMMTAFATPINDGPIKEGLKKLVDYSSKAGELVNAAMEQGQLGELIKNSFSLGAKKGINAILESFSSLPSMLAGPLANVAKLIAAASTGNVGLIMAALSSFSTENMKFDTTGEEKFFAELEQRARESAEKMKAILAEVTLKDEADAAANAPLPTGPKKPKTKSGTVETRGALLNEELGPKPNPNPKKSKTQIEDVLTDRFFGPGGEQPGPQAAKNNVKKLTEGLTKTQKLSDPPWQREDKQRRDSAFDGKRRTIYGFGRGPNISPVGKLTDRKREREREAEKQAQNRVAPRWDSVVHIEQILGGLGVA